MPSVLYTLYTAVNNKSGKSSINFEQFKAGVYYRTIYCDSGLTLRSIDYRNVKVDQSVIKDWDEMLLNRINCIRELREIDTFLGVRFKQLIIKVVIDEEKISGRSNYDMLRLALDDIYFNFVAPKGL